MLNAPILLFCAERSGSNLITRIFDAHSTVCAPGASHLFKVMSECACRYPAGSDALRDAVMGIFAAKVSAWQIDARPRAALRALLDPLARAGEMVAALYAAEAAARGKAHVFIKENSAFAYLNFVAAQSEGLRVLFMLRDPRDMALSWVKGPVMRGGVLRATDRWLHDQTGYLQAISQLPAGTRVGTLRYEDLIARPEAEITRVCAELAVPFEPAMLEFHDRSEGAKQDAKRSSMWSNLSKPMLQDNARKFLTGLSDDEIAYIEAMTAPLADAFGYASVRGGKPRFGRFDTLEALRAEVSRHEPHSKPAYAALPQAERDRFEAWSRLHAEMQARPRLTPAEIRPLPA